MGADAGAGAGADAEDIGGEFMSKRSPMPLLAAGGLFIGGFGGGGGEAADEKSPQSPPKLSFRGARAGAAAGWEGGDMGFAGGEGFMSKNDPPLRAGFEVEEACRECPVGEVRPANGEGLAC